MKIYELETKNGRTFRVAIANKSQEQRLMKMYNDNIKNNEYEKFVSIKEVLFGIHDIKTFERQCEQLQ